MKEIKFRGKNIRNNAWCYGFLSKGYFEPGCEDKFVILQEKSFAVVFPETIGQYTGVKDKYGREIYEGDICKLRYPDGYKIGIIEYENGCFYWNDNTVGFWKDELEIIGNIHDNPELLKSDNSKN